MKIKTKLFFSLCALGFVTLSSCGFVGSCSQDECGLCSDQRTGVKICSFNPAPGSETIKLRNYGSTVIDIGGWYIRDKATVDAGLTTPQILFLGGEIIGANTTLDIPAPDITFTLEASGEMLSLFDNTGTLQSQKSN